MLFRIKTAMAWRTVGLPGWFDTMRPDDSPAAFLRESLTPGQLVEGDLGADGRILFVAGQKSRATRLGYWVDGVLLGGTSRSWVEWYAGHRPAEEGGGLFHFCLSLPCVASARRANLAIVHVPRFRPLTIEQARALAYAKGGLQAYEAALDGTPVDDGGDDGGDSATEGTNEEAAAVNEVETPVKAGTPKKAAAPAVEAKGAPALDPALSRALAAADTAVAADGSTGLPRHGGLGAPVLNGPPAKKAAEAGVKAPGAVTGEAAKAAEASRALPKGPSAASKSGMPGSRSGIYSALLSQAQRFEASRKSASEPLSSEAKRRKVVASFVDLMAGGSGAAASDDLVEVEDPFAEGADAVFRAAPISSNGESLAMLSRRTPGRLFELGLQKIKERLLALQGSPAGAADQDLRRVLSFYHEVIFKARHPHAGTHTLNEMATVAESVDCLVEGDLGRLGDVLLQRYKALERSCQDGNWVVAQELEVLEHNRSGLATDDEVWRSSRRQLHSAQLQRTLESLSRHSSDGARQHRG